MANLKWNNYDRQWHSKHRSRNQEMTYTVYYTAWRRKKKNKGSKDFKGLIYPSNCLPSWSSNFCFTSLYPKLMPVSLGIAAGIVAKLSILEVGWWLMQSPPFNLPSFVRAQLRMVTNQSGSDKKRRIPSDCARAMCLALFQNGNSSELGPNCRHPIHGHRPQRQFIKYSSDVHALQYPLECYTIHSHLLAIFFPRVHSPIAASGALETLIKAAKSRKGSKRQTWNNKTQPDLELPCIWVLIISSPRCEMAGVAQCPRATPLVAPQNNCSTGLGSAKGHNVPWFLNPIWADSISWQKACLKMYQYLWNAPVAKPGSNGGTIRQNCKTSPNPLLIDEFGSNAFKCSDSTITKDVKNSNKSVAG